MDKKTAVLLSTVAGVATMGVAQAADAAMPNPAQAMQVSSYADLLAPVENAVAAMQADDTARIQKVVPEGNIEDVQYYYYGPPRYHHHHHHHHHHAYYHHHHHHHHHAAVIGVPGVGVVIGGR